MRSKIQGITIAVDEHLMNGQHSRICIAVTGANGFLGRAVSSRIPPNCDLTRLVRRDETGSTRTVSIGDLGIGSIPDDALSGCHAVIHTAARTHLTGKSRLDELAIYRKVNVEGTRSIIVAMERAAVRRLVYVSSIKALSEYSHGCPLYPRDKRHPEDAYGISKAEAEDVVLRAHKLGRIDAVIVRPVLVHGPGAKGNLERLLMAVANHRWLPFGAIRNRRSLIGVDNLADALIRAAIFAGRMTSRRLPIYHVADDGVISTSRIVDIFAEEMGVQLRMLPVPHPVASIGAAMLGRSRLIHRLYGDLEVNDRDFRIDFNWSPQMGLEEGLRLVARGYISRAHMTNKVY